MSLTGLVSQHRYISTRNFSDRDRGLRCVCVQALRHHRSVMMTPQDEAEAASYSKRREWARHVRVALAAHDGVQHHLKVERKGRQGVGDRDWQGEGNME